MRQHQNTNNKVVDNEKGGVRHNQILPRSFVPAQPKGRGGERERESVKLHFSCSLRSEKNKERESLLR